MTDTARCAQCGTAIAAYTIDGFCPACLLECALLPEAAMSLEVVGQHIGRYELQEEIARGGMGVVYKAHDMELSRTVALKLILSGNFASPKEVARFRAEGRAVAALKHPNIVAIHEVGENEGRQFFVMDFVTGLTLRDLIRDHPLPARRAATCLKTIAEAVHYAHERGIVHRDLKPSNVIIDGNDQPHVTDFGLAKHLGSQADLTLSGVTLGTPGYMAPEQARGQSNAVGPAADVYSLGAILYELLTGRPPFRAETALETMAQAVHQEPVPPRLLNSTVPRDLETICLKCLEKDPSRRYGSTKELSAELGRYLHDEPVLARPVGRGEKFARWTHRHPVIAVLVGVIGLLLVLVASVSTVAVTRLQQANREGQEKLREAYLSQAKANRWSARPGRRFNSLEVIGKAAAIRPGLDLRNEAIAATALTDFRVAKRLELRGMEHFAISPDYSRYAYWENGTGMRMWTAGASVPEQPSLQSTGICSALVFSKEGRWLLMGVTEGNSHRLTLLESDTGKLALSVDGFWVRCADFSADGRWMVVATRLSDRSFGVLYDMSTLKPVHTNMYEDLPWSTQFDPQGNRIAVSRSDSRRVQLFDRATGTLIETLRHSNGVQRIEWSPTGLQLATSGHDGFAYLWDLSGPEKTLAARLRHGDVVSAVRFHPSGNYLASVGWNNQLKVWDLKDGRAILSRPEIGHWDAPFSADGQWLAARSETGSLEILEIAWRPAFSCLRLDSNRDQRTTVAAFHPNGRWVASVHPDCVSLWDLVSQGELARLPVVGAAFAEFDPEGRRLFTKDGSGALIVWPLSEEGFQGGTIGNSMTIGPPITIAQLPRTGAPCDGRMEKMCFVEGDNLRIVRLPGGEDIHRISIPEPLDVLNLDRSGRFCMGRKQGENRVYIWNALSGEMFKSLDVPEVSRTAFSPDGRLFFTATGLDCTCWDTRSWKRLYSFRRTDSGNTPTWIAFSDDSRLGAMNLSQTSVRLFLPSTGDDVATIDDPDGQILGRLRLNHEGSRLAVSADGCIRLWDLDLVRDELKRLNLDWEGSSSVRVSLANASSQVRSFRVIKVPLPPRERQCGANLVDLSTHYNVPITNFDTFTRIRGNGLTALPVGLQEFAGLPFDVRGLVLLGLSAVPKEVKNISIQRTCTALNFLHSAAFITSNNLLPGTEVAEYIVHYADKSQERIPIRNQLEIEDWWVPRKRSSKLDTNTTLVAWQGDNETAKAFRHQIEIQRFRWKNSRPQIPIISIDFRAINGGPFLLAITTE